MSYTTGDEIREIFGRVDDDCSETADLLDKILKERIGKPPAPYGVWVWTYQVKEANEQAKRAPSYWDAFADNLNNSITEMVNRK